MRVYSIALLSFLVALVVIAAAATTRQADGSSQLSNAVARRTKTVDAIC